MKFSIFYACQCTKYSTCRIIIFSSLHWTLRDETHINQTKPKSSSFGQSTSCYVTCILCHSNQSYNEMKTVLNSNKHFSLGLGIRIRLSCKTFFSMPSVSTDLSMYKCLACVGVCNTYTNRIYLNQTLFLN